MKVKAIVCAGLAGVMLLCCGCTDGHKLSELTIVQGMGIDEENGGAKVALQYLNLARSNGSTESLSDNITAVAYGKANTVSDAVNNASKTLSKEMFFGQNKVIVFGKQYVENSLVKGMDYLLRSVGSRPDVPIAMSDGTAASIIKNEARGARIPAESLNHLLTAGEKNGFAAVVSVNTLLNLYRDSTSDIYLPVLTAQGKHIACAGMAVFSNEQYALTLTPAQTLGFLLVQGKPEGALLTVQHPSLGRVSLRMLASRMKKSAFLQEERLVFRGTLRCSFMVEEVENGMREALDETLFKELEILANSKLETLCENAVSTCFSHHSDPFMTARYLAVHEPKHYRALKDNWREVLPSAAVRFRVVCAVQRINAHTK